MTPASAAAVPPPVEASPVVITADPQGEFGRAVSGLVHELGRGHISAIPVPVGIGPPDCRLDDPERLPCFAEAARHSAMGQLVFVLAEPAGERARISCVGQDSARSQQAEISLEIARGSDEIAALRERSTLSGCIIGALHAPPRA
jgi:hypothetical protein